MTAVEIVAIATDEDISTLTMRAVVRSDNTVGAIIDGMPMVAPTPYLVLLAETACFRLIERLLNQQQISVGRHLAIDHLGPSKVGAVLEVEAKVRSQGSKYACEVKIHDGGRLVANVQHIRVAVHREVIMNSLR